MKKGEINLNLMDSFKLFMQSFNRAQYFSCIADSYTIDMLPANWAISKPNGFKYSITPPNEDSKQKFVQGFQHSTQRYLVRDCIESFSLSLDNLFFLLLLHGKNGKSNQTLHEILSEKEKKLLKAFQNAGLSSKEGKLQLLKTHFGISLPKNYTKIIAGLRDIRNCLSHHNGIVRQTDGKKDGNNKRKFYWTTFDIWAEGLESGKKYDLEIGQIIPEASNILIGLNNNDHHKSFPIGSHLIFSPSETYEIALSLHQVMECYLKEIKDKILSKKKRKDPDAQKKA